MPTSGWMSLLSIFALFYLALLIKIYHNFRNFEARGIWTWSTSNSYKNIGVKRAMLVPVTMQHFKTSASTRHLILPKRITPATQFSRFRRELSWPRNRTVTSRVWYSGSCDRIGQGYSSNKTTRAVSWFRGYWGSRSIEQGIRLIWHVSSGCSSSDSRMLWNEPVKVYGIPAMFHVILPHYKHNMPRFAHLYAMNWNCPFWVRCTSF